LGKGTLEGEALTCPWHGSQFNVTSGRLVRWVQEPAWLRLMSGLIPAFMRRSVASYEVRVEDGRVLVKL
jgi:nitrite reductase/ring-hydroxylating ferredoxin subunit